MPRSAGDEVALGSRPPPSSLWTTALGTVPPPQDVEHRTTTCLRPDRVLSDAERAISEPHPPLGVDHPWTRANARDAHSEHHSRTTEDAPCERVGQVPALRLAPRCACLRSGRGGPTELFGSNSRVNAHALIEDTMCPQWEADPLSPGRPHAFPHGRLTSTVYPAIQSVDLGTCFEGSSRGGPQGRSLPSPASAATRCRALGLRFAWGRNPSDFAAWARFRTPKPPKTSRQPHCGKARVSELFFCTRAYRWILYLLILRAYGDRPRTCASGETFMYSATSHLSAAVTTILGRPSTETSQ